MKDRGAWKAGIFLILMLAAAVSWAHIPMVVTTDTTGYSDALKIPRPGVSWALYANLDSSTDVDFYSFELSAPMPCHVTVIVPYLPGYEDFYPAFAVVGPGLPAPKVALPFELPQGYGAVVEKPTGATPRPTFFEEFSRKKYYKGISEFKQKLGPGKYYIVVWHPGCETGAYVVGFGDKEGFTIRDWVNVAKVMPTIKKDAWIGKRAKTATPGECKPVK